MFFNKLFLSFDNAKIEYAQSSDLEKKDISRSPVRNNRNREHKRPNTLSGYIRRKP